MVGLIMSVEDLRLGIPTTEVAEDVIQVEGVTYIKAIQNQHGRVYYDGMDWLKNGMKEKTFLEFNCNEYDDFNVRITCDAIYYDGDGVEPIYGEYTMNAGPNYADYLVVDNLKLYVIGKICPEVSTKFGHRYNYLEGRLEVPFTYHSDWLLEESYVGRTDMQHDLFILMEEFTGITHCHYVRRR